MAGATSPRRTRYLHVHITYSSDLLPEYLPLVSKRMPPTPIETQCLSASYWSRSRKWTPETPSSCTSRCRIGIDALALRHPWNGAVQRPSRRTRVHFPLSCAAPSERLSKQCQRHAMRHGIFKLPNAVINGASELLVHLACWGRQSALFCSPRPDLRWTCNWHWLCACRSLQLIGPVGPCRKAPGRESLCSFSLSYDGSPVIRRYGGTRGDNRKTLGDGWRRKWAHFAVPVA